MPTYGSLSLSDENKVFLFSSRRQNSKYIWSWLILNKPTRRPTLKQIHRLSGIIQNHSRKIKTNQAVSWNSNPRAVANCLSLYYMIPQISFLAHEHLTYVITTDSWVYREILTVGFINSHWSVYSTKLKVYTYQTTSCDSVSNFCQDL